ncbi:hypothetical protein WA026_015468 [Henosepilachna vigintioctopunctata]|uniref:Secreted protein n=1 Tax=Henosepilachna vigintioctopunctata TaxID=420089 RepID=A0AAW1UNE2_9CUCU
METGLILIPTLIFLALEKLSLALVIFREMFIHLALSRRTISGGERSFFSSFGGDGRSVSSRFCSASNFFEVAVGVIPASEVFLRLAGSVEVPGGWRLCSLSLSVRLSGNFFYGDFHVTRFIVAALCRCFLLLECFQELEGLFCLVHALCIPGLYYLRYLLGDVVHGCVWDTTID